MFLGEGSSLTGSRQTRLNMDQQELLLRVLMRALFVSVTFNLERSVV